METEKKLLESPERFTNRDILRIIGEPLGRELETDELDDCLTTIGFTWDQVAELEIISVKDTMWIFGSNQT
jgi:hypothetical protein